MAECISQACGDRPEDTSLLLLHYTLGHRLEQLLEVAKELCPNTQVAGCSGSGVVGQGWVSEAMRALAVMAVTGDEVHAVKVAGVTATTSREQARACAASLKEALPATRMLLLFGPGFNVDARAIIDGVEEVFGRDVPIAGALAAWCGKDLRTSVLLDDAGHDDGLLMVGLADATLSLCQGSHHERSPLLEHPLTVTRGSGVRVDEFNGVPAWHALTDALGMPRESGPVELGVLNAFGIALPEAIHAEYASKYILRSINTVREDGSVYFSCSVPVGTLMVPCQRDEERIFTGVDSLVRRLKDRVANRTLVAVFHADCIARGRMGHAVIEKTEIIERMQRPFVTGDIPFRLEQSGKVPWLGVYGAGEFAQLAGRNDYHHVTTSLSLLVRSVA